jgi:hypothetical protein
MQEQASWVCQCDDEVVNQLEADFKATLAQQVSSKCIIIVLQACKKYFLQMHVVLIVEMNLYIISYFCPLINRIWLI